eukprot:TRINITY_DN25652_c0_g1_i1.p1 TRINITY_DN25652_c0_g1~~TRINITY_DN25652_c0_g1_i1.p1  ORF type:complete len:1025 (-),score=202.29 TRINITY_DN25652_c0_g1_i1:144-3218(-)
MQSVNFSATLQPRTGNTPSVDRNGTSPCQGFGGLNGSPLAAGAASPPPLAAASAATAAFGGVNGSCGAPAAAAGGGAAAPPRHPAFEPVNTNGVDHAAAAPCLPDAIKAMPGASPSETASRASPGGWTPGYSPAFKAGSAAAQASNSTLLPPPPPTSSGGYGGAGYGGYSPSPSGGYGAATPASCSSSRRFEVPASPAVRTPGSTLGDHSRGSKDRCQPLSPAARRNNLHARPNEKAPRIDPEQVPRPSGQEVVLKEECGQVYETSKYQVPPSATAMCTIVDKGSCSCEFLRCTTNQVPALPATANSVQVPIGVVCQPFAELTPFEAPIPLVDLGEAGPLRCTRCKAYANAYFQFHSQGRMATCNFCGQRMDLPEEYICALDERGNRHDIRERPELRLGTVDYHAPRDYSDDRLPGAPAIAVVVEASGVSLRTGVFARAMETLRSVLDFPRGDEAPRLALIVFDQALHFFAFKAGVEDAREIVVADIEDPFVPCGHDELCADTRDEGIRAQFDALLERLPQTFGAERCSDVAAGGAALKVATELLAAQGGGHAIMVHATLPSTGIGALRARDDIALYSAPEGAGLLAPQQSGFYEAVAQDCVDAGVAVSAICLPEANAYIDMATLSMVPRKTGGNVRRIVGFHPFRDGEVLHHTLARAIVQPAAHSCIFKLRCSRGLTVENMYAPWDAEVIDPSTFQLPRMSADSTALFTLARAERVDDVKHVYLQAACLYTDVGGRRRIRVQTLQLPITTSMASVFKFTEIDSVTSVLIKQAASLALAGNGTFKEKITKATVNMLHAYRVNCASMTSSGQLILPEALKLLPVYVSSIRKMAAFRSGSDIRVDERMTGLVHILGLSLAQISALIYPKVYPVCPLAENDGVPTGVADFVRKPATIACTINKCSVEKIYLIDNGLALYLYIRPQVPTDLLEEYFGVTALADAAGAFMAAASGEIAFTQAGARVWAVVQQIRRERWRLPWQPLHVILPGSPDEGRLLALFCEDSVAGEMPYVDFLCYLHKQVQNKND